MANNPLIPLNILFDFFLGFCINNCATSFLSTASIAGSADILRRALASANGFFVISADPASAMYSRLREMAKRIRLAKRKPIAAISKAINMKMKMRLIEYQKK